MVSVALLAAFSLFTLSCNKKFDEPPGYIPPNVTPTMTIAELRAMHVSGSYEPITTPDIIEGVVVANDSSGNFYKQIVIEDETAGITLAIDDYNLYTSFPVGRRVYVNLNGLYLNDYNGLVQLGGGLDGTGAVTRIAAGSVDTYLIKGDFNQPITPIVVSSIASLDDSYQSRLIQLDGFEFASSDTAKTYADAVNKLSVNFTLTNCTGDKIVLRNSGFADFATYNVPNGNGTIYAIYSVFGSTKQIFIRDTNDVQFYNDWCTPSGGGGGGTNTEKWLGGTFSGNNFAKITAFKSGTAVVKTWLVTPSINLTGVSSPVLTFNSLDGYDNGATLKAYISTNYNGSATPWTATWTPLSATISSGHTSGYAPSFTASGNISLSAYTGNVYIAFVYEGGDPGKTTTFEVDDVKVASGSTNVFSEDFASVVKDAAISLSGWVNAPQ